MLPPESLRAFVLAAELGSFSAAARRMGKAQSAVSTAIANLEIDAGVDLFDRSGRSPVLTAQGQALLPHARGILLGQEEFIAKAGSMAGDVEGTLCLAVEQGVHLRPLLTVIAQFEARFPQVELEFLSTGPNDAAALLKEGRADLGLMIEQEGYPTGFQFRGVGHTVLVPVCSRDHPLAQVDRVTYRDLRQFRQIIPRSRGLSAVAQLGERKSATVWYAESPVMIADLVSQGLGWAELPLSVAGAQIDAGHLVRLHYAFQQSDVLAGIDVVWTERRGLGVAGQWLCDHLLDLPQEAWRRGR